MVEKFTDINELWDKCVSFHGHECGEKTSENMIRLENGRHLCKDCYTPYRKFY